MTVTSGTRALRSACRTITLRSERPFTRAVVMYSCPSSASRKLRVIRLMYASDSGQDDVPERVAEDLPFAAQGAVDEERSRDRRNDVVVGDVDPAGPEDPA